MREFQWSTVPSCTNPTTTPHAGTLSGLHLQLVQGATLETKDGPAFCGATFRNCYRKKSNVISVDFVMLDFDKVPTYETFDPMCSIYHLAHTTFSDVPQGPRSFRMLVPLASSVSADDYIDVWEYAASQAYWNEQETPHGADRGASDASRLCYMPRKEASIMLQAGALLNPLDPGVLEIRERRLKPKRRRQTLPLSHDWEWLGGALQNIDHNPYENWLRVGLALKTADAEGCGEARSLFLGWAEGSDATESNHARQWDGFAPGDCGPGTIWHLAEQGGWLAPRKSGAVDSAYQNKLDHWRQLWNSAK